MVDYGDSWSSKNSDSPLIRTAVSMDPLAMLFPGLGEWKIKTSDKLQNWVSDNIAKNDPFINFERKHGPSHWFSELRPISDWAREKPLDATGLVVGGVVGAGALAGAGGAAGGAAGGSSAGGLSSAGSAGLWEGAFAGTSGFSGAAYGSAPAAGISGIGGTIGGSTGAAAGGVGAGTWINAGLKGAGALGAMGTPQQGTQQQAAAPQRPQPRYPSRMLNGQKYVQMNGQWYVET